VELYVAAWSYCTLDTHERRQRVNNVGTRSTASLQFKLLANKGVKPIDNYRSLRLRLGRGETERRYEGQK